MPSRRPFPSSERTRFTVFATAFLLFAVVCGGRVLGQAALDVNLLVNGDAETGPASVTGEDVITPAGWTGTGNATAVKYPESAGARFPTVTGTGPIERGANFLAGGPASAASSLTQTVDVSALAALVDTAAVNATLAAFLGGAVDDDDNARLTVSFLNAAGEQLSAAVLGPVLAADRGDVTSLLPRRRTLPVPAETRAVRLTVNFTRLAGTYNSSYADDLQLILHRPPAPPAEPDMFSPLVAGVRKTAYSGTPGSLLLMDPAWQTIMAGDDDHEPFPAAAAAARLYGTGRVIAFGGDQHLVPSVYNTDDSAVFLKNCVRWLDRRGLKKVAVTQGHREFAGPLQFNALAAEMAAEGFAFSYRNAPVTASSLSTVSVLIAGNAWGNFSQAEIAAVEEFVRNGGGLWIIGLGWSWEPYNTGRTMSDYPVIRMAEPYGVWWDRAYLVDGTPPATPYGTLQVFHPETPAWTVAWAGQTLASLHAQHRETLPAVLEADPAKRQAAGQAHGVFAMAARELPAGHPAKAEAFETYTSLLAQYPGYYSRRQGLDQTAHPASVLLRERSWATATQLLPPDPQRTGRLAAAVHLPERVRDILEAADLALLDNGTLSEPQVDFLFQLFETVPRDLHQIRALGTWNVFSSSPLTVSINSYMDQRPLGWIRIHDTPMEAGSETYFIDSILGTSTIPFFCAAAVFELSYRIDIDFIQKTPAWLEHRTALISRAGADRLNYLHSEQPDGALAGNPGGFLAYSSKNWLTDSAKSLELAAQRFGEGRPEPLNHVLFLADLYSRGGLSTPFWNISRDGRLDHRSGVLSRDAGGRINSLTLGPHLYRFTLDTDGFVTGLNISQNSPAGIAVWPETAAAPEGGIAPVYLQLTAPPAGDATVFLEWTSGDSDLQIAAAGSVTFTPQNWRVPQAVRLAAGADADALNGTAVFTASSPGLASYPLTVTEAESDPAAYPLTPDRTAEGPQFTYRRDKLTPQVTLVPQSSPDLLNWSNATTALSDTVLEEDERHQTRLLRPLSPAATEPRLFYRFRIR